MIQADLYSFDKPVSAKNIVALYSLVRVKLYWFVKSLTEISQNNYFLLHKIMKEI